MGREFRPADDQRRASAASRQPNGPFAQGPLPEASEAAEPVEVLRLVVVLRMLGPRDFLAGVEREPGGVKLAGCRATDPLAAVQGATAGAVEVMRARLREDRP